MGTHFIYVALCKDNTLYTGYTTNVEKRIMAHNNGTGAKYMLLNNKRVSKK